MTPEEKQSSADKRQVAQAAHGNTFTPWSDDCPACLGGMLVFRWQAAQVAEAEAVAKIEEVRDELSDAKLCWCAETSHPIIKCDRCEMRDKLESALALLKKEGTK